MSIVRSAAVVGSLVSLVAAHGYVSGIVANGIYYLGYNPAFQYANPAPAVAGWSDPDDLGNGFIDPNNYTTPEIICHLGATPGAASVNVAAGDSIELQWTPWPTSHHGPVLDYLAPVSGDFASIDKTQLQFFKIGAVGLINDNPPPGTWATDQLIANNNSWVVTIPKTIAPGKYVLRHEIIALHAAGQTDGAQNYPQCVNLVVSGGRSETPAGESAEKFYTPSDPGIKIDIYSPISSYVMPGPALYSGAISAAQTSLPITSYAATTTSGGGGSSPTTTSKLPTTAPTTSTTLATITKRPDHDDDAFDHRIYHDY